MVANEMKGPDRKATIFPPSFSSSFSFRGERSMVMEFVVRQNASSTLDPFIADADRWDENMDGLVIDSRDFYWGNTGYFSGEEKRGEHSSRRRGTIFVIC